MPYISLVHHLAYFTIHIWDSGARSSMLGEVLRGLKGPQSINVGFVVAIELPKEVEQDRFEKRIRRPDCVYSYAVYGDGTALLPPRRRTVYTVYSRHCMGNYTMDVDRNRVTDSAPEESFKKYFYLMVRGFIEKRRQMSSMLFRGPNLFNSLPR